MNPDKDKREELINDTHVLENGAGKPKKKPWSLFWILLVILAYILFYNFTFFFKKG